jgi:hydrogenase maturation protease
MEKSEESPMAQAPRIAAARSGTMENAKTPSEANFSSLSGLYLVCPACRAERLLFVDAARDGTPGSVTRKPVAPAASPSAFFHELGPEDILKLAGELYGRCPPAHLLTIAGELFETGDTMSLSVMAAIPEAMAQIRQFVEGERE